MVQLLYPLAESGRVLPKGSVLALPSEFEQKLIQNGNAVCFEGLSRTYAKDMPDFDMDLHFSNSFYNDAPKFNGDGETLDNLDDEPDNDNPNSNDTDFDDPTNIEDSIDLAEEYTEDGDEAYTDEDGSQIILGRGLKR